MSALFKKLFYLCQNKRKTDMNIKKKLSKDLSFNIIAKIFLKSVNEMSLFLCTWFT